MSPLHFSSPACVDPMYSALDVQHKVCTILQIHLEAFKFVNEYYLEEEKKILVFGFQTPV